MVADIAVSKFYFILMLVYFFKSSIISNAPVFID